MVTTKKELIDKLAQVLGNGIEKPKMSFLEQHKCLIEHLLSKTDIQYDFFAGEKYIHDTPFHKGYIVADCKSQVDAAINVAIAQKNALYAIFEEIKSFDASALQIDRLLGSPELNLLMKTSRKQQDEARIGFYDEYKLECYSKAGDFTAEDAKLAMHRCDSIYEDTPTRYDTDISIIKETVKHLVHDDL